MPNPESVNQRVVVCGLERILWTLVLSATFSATVEALPQFARRYSLPCHFCHDGFPKLSPLGEQFKERGFRLQGETSDVRDWIRSVPISARATLRQTFEEDGDAETFGLVKVLSAGNLGDRFAYWIDDTLFYSWEKDEDGKRKGFDHVGVDNAYARLELLPDELYLRAGRVELDLPFTQVRSPNLFAYEIYFTTTGFETDVIGAHQDGVEAGGFLEDTTRWFIEQ